MIAALRNGSRVRKALVLAAGSGLLTCVLAFVPSPLLLLQSFAPVATAEVKLPPTVKLSEPPALATFASITERPLFNADRKADPEPPPPEPAKPVVTLGDLTQFRLVGVVASKGAQLALVRRGEAPATTLRVGDTLDGWKVEKIDAAGVALSGGDQQGALAIPKAENRGFGSTPAVND